MRILKKIALGLSLLLFCFCSKMKSEWPRLVVPKSDNAIRVKSNEMLQSIPPILAVNFVGDTTIIRKKYNIPNDYLLFNDDSLKAIAPLRIFIDTTYVFQSSGYLFKRVKYPPPMSRDSLEKYDYNEMQLPGVKRYFDEKEALEKSLYPFLPSFSLQPVIKSAAIV